MILGLARIPSVEQFLQAHHVRAAGRGIGQSVEPFDQPGVKTGLAPISVLPEPIPVGVRLHRKDAKNAKA